MDENGQGFILLMSMCLILFDLAAAHRVSGTAGVQKVFVSFGSVTASFGHYDVSGTTYVVPDLHAKIGHVDPELSCRQK